MEFPTVISPCELNLSITTLLPSTNPFSANASIAPRVPSSSSNVEACCKSPMCGILRAVAVLRPRSDKSSTADAKTIRTTPSARRLTTKRMCTRKENGDDGRRVYHPEEVRKPSSELQNRAVEIHSAESNISRFSELFRSIPKLGV